MAQLISEWDMSCKKCIGELKIDRIFTLFLLKNPNDYNTAPEHSMQTNLVPILPPSGDFESFLTAMDVFPAFNLPTNI